MLLFPITGQKLMVMGIQVYLQKEQELDKKWLPRNPHFSLIPKISENVYTTTE